MPMVPIHLYRGDHGPIVPLYALLDSGADRSIMPSNLAESLGILDIASGRLEQTVGVGTQVVDIYYHDDIQIELVGNSQRFELEIGFINGETQMHMPLLGRTFFSLFKSIAFEEKGGTIEIKAF